MAKVVKLGKYVGNRKVDWGMEFAEILEMPHRPEFGNMAGMGAYTMLHKVADEFQDGKYRAQILKQFGIKDN